MNIDASEQYLARLTMGTLSVHDVAIKAYALEQAAKAHARGKAALCVSPVKGFDASAHKAERERAKRARKLARKRA
jgi:hypothetical protein